MISLKKLDGFLVTNRISRDQWELAKLTWSELVAIGVDYESQIPHLEATAGLMASIIQRFTKVHSVRWRVKDTEHLLSKIIRKRSLGSEKYLNVTVENYGDVVTDLIGMRALHLFKSDFADIHAEMATAFSFAETPVVYVREGDNPELKKAYDKAGFEVQDHPEGYRSIHYVTITKPLKRRIHVEIQVRTIFEEGWSEIDHTIRYPNFSDDVQIAYLLAIFNRMAGSADEVGDFVKTLSRVLTDAKEQINAAIEEKNQSVAKMEAALQQLATEKNDKSASDQISVVQGELEKLKKNSSRSKSSNSTRSVRADQIQAMNDFHETRASITALDDPGGIKAALAAMNVSEGVLAQMRALDDSSGIKAAMEAIEDPGGINAAMKAVEDPGGIKAAMKAIDDPGGIKAAFRALEWPGGALTQLPALNDPGGIRAGMNSIDDPGGIKAALKGLEKLGIVAQKRSINDREGLEDALGAFGDQGRLKAILTAMEDPAGALAMKKAIDDLGWLKAEMKGIEDPGGIKAALKALNYPGGALAQLKMIEDPGGIKALLKELRLPPK